MSEDTSERRTSGTDVDSKDPKDHASLLISGNLHVRGPGQERIWQEFYPLLPNPNNLPSRDQGKRMIERIWTTGESGACRAMALAYVVVLYSCTLLSVTGLMLCKVWNLDSADLTVICARALWMISPILGAIVLRQVGQARVSSRAWSLWDVGSPLTLFRFRSVSRSIHTITMCFWIPLVCAFFSYLVCAVCDVVEPMNQEFVDRVTSSMGFNNGHHAKQDSIVTYFVYTIAVGMFWDRFPPDKFDFGVALGRSRLGCSWFLLSVAEEIGWSGSLYPTLYAAFPGSNAPFASLITGLIWSIWYWPVMIAEYLGAIPDGTGYEIGRSKNSPLSYVLMSFTSNLVGTRILIGTLQGAKCWIWPGAVFHAAYDMFVFSVFGQFTAPKRRQAHVFVFFSDKASAVLAAITWGTIFITSIFSCLKRKKQKPVSLRTQALRA